MSITPTVRRFCLVGVSLLSILWAAGLIVLGVSGHEGQVRFGETPVPGAAILATQGSTTVRAVTDVEGRYSLPNLKEGSWKIRVSAPGFEAVEREIVLVPDTPATQWDLKMLPIEGLQRSAPTQGFPKTASPDLLTSV